MNTPDIRSIFHSMTRMQERMSGTPTAIVTTEETFAALTEEMRKTYGPVYGSDFTVYGIKVEIYPTVRKCLDRMMEPKKGDRLQLVTKEGIPVDCFDHPWLKQVVTNMLPKGSEVYYE